MKPVMRELEPADEAAVLALFAESAEYFLAATGLPSGPGDVQSLYYALPAGADPAAKQLLVIESDGQLVGIVDIVVGHPTADAASCGLFLLAPSARRRGVGSAVAAELLATARRTGVTRLSATVPSSAPAGRQFLRTLGFAEAPLDDRATIGNRTAWPGESGLLAVHLEL